jgi:hypothetical protein
MLAKLVGKTVKPDGLARIDAADADAFCATGRSSSSPASGHAHAKTLRSMNFATIGDLRALPPKVLEALFGANGRLLHERCRGNDTAPVTEREIPLSISRETSFHQDTADRAEIEGMLEYLVGRACRAARELAIRPRTVAVHVRYSDGEGDEQARSLHQASDTDPVVLELALELLRRLFTRRVALHAVGVKFSNFAAAGGEQGSLFDEREAGRRARCSARSTACVARTATARSCRAARCGSSTSCRKIARLRAADAVTDESSGAAPETGLFTPLRVFSHGSLLHGIAAPETLVAQALERGYESLALTDRDNLYLAVRYWQTAHAEGLRPLLGAVLTARDHEALLVAVDRRGFAHLCELITLRMLDPKFDLVAALAPVDGRSRASGLTSSSSRRGSRRRSCARASRRRAAWRRGAARTRATAGCGWACAASPPSGARSRRGTRWRASWNCRSSRRAIACCSSPRIATHIASR